jgi:hypothetical protein
MTAVDTTTEAHIEHIADLLDRLATLDIRPRREQGVVGKLYEAARRRQGKSPTLAAAELLLGVVKPRSTVMIATGAGHPDFLPYGETDGPPGAVALATVLAVGMDAVPVLLTEAAFVENLTATAVAGGLGVRDFDSAHRAPFTCCVVSFPSDDSAPEVAHEYLHRFQPVVLVATEKLGPNADGVAHYASGVAVTPDRARVEELFDLAPSREIPTIGIGDSGNEIGFGAIQDAVREHKRWGNVCQCPCEGGIATRVATDAIVVGNTSNWAAYAVGACLAAMLGRPDLVRDAMSEHRVLDRCAMSGAADGATLRAASSVDGTPAEVSASVHQLMRSTVEICTARPYKRPF